MDSMKITIDIPDEELKDAMRFTRATTKREAVVTALEEFNRRLRIAGLTKHFGTSDTFMTHAELMKVRRVDRSAMTLVARRVSSSCRRWASSGCDGAAAAGRFQ